MTVVAYIRVSTGKQAESGLGLEAQRHAIAAAAERLGLVVREEHTDAGLSGGDEIEDRPGLIAALASLRPGDVLMVAKRDRLARDMYLALMIERVCEQRGATIRTVDGQGDEKDPASLLLRRIIDAVAEYERLIGKARTRAALGALRRSHRRFSGHAPLGWKVADDGQQLVPNETEQKAIEFMLAMHAKGDTTLTIARRLDRMGVPTRTGRPWSRETVRKAIVAATAHTATKEK